MLYIYKVSTLVFTITFFAFFYHWYKQWQAKRKAGQEYMNDAEYLSYKGKKRKIGYVCLLAFVLGYITEPEPTPEELARKEAYKQEQAIKESDKHSLNISPEKFATEYNAAVDYFAKKDGKNYNSLKISNHIVNDQKTGTFYTNGGDIMIGYFKNNENSEYMCGMMFSGSLSKETINAISYMIIAAVPEKATRGKGLNLLTKGNMKEKAIVKSDGYVFSNLMDGKTIVFMISDEEYFNSMENKAMQKQ
ncbi:hypothetical protein [Anaerovibrio lipolyticus]|uniref:hypothetical protein n=1 Tax=Anaerovibrio lipolyticus TaxID=82374 RepID=UPI0026F330B8|nr:hypothetical protein [Anaerovibrio lipolyticus]MBE6105812.1 hypothetical protein [Anaerovibrio lipolyticus]